MVLRVRRLVLLLSAVVIASCGETVDGGSGPVFDPGDSDSDAPLPPATPVALDTLALRSGEALRWRITGEALEGTEQGLTSLSGHNAFWFAWSIFHPGTSVFGQDSMIAGEPAQGDDECAVPCDQIRPACAGRDCIPSLESPSMVPADSAELGYLQDTDEVVGVLTSDGPRAYPHNILWWHEIVNETVGEDAFAVTFCPLTGSGLLFDRTSFVPGQTVELGVSGNLYNSNLTMYDRTTESFWSQMRADAIFGSELGAAMTPQPLFEMTWGSWRQLYPDTRVVSENTGHRRNYTRYPYGDYRTNHGNTFRRTDPHPDPRFDNKAMTFGVFVEGEVRAYPWEALAATVGSRRGVVHDEIGATPVVLVFDLDARYVHAFDARVDGTVRTFEFEGPAVER